MTESIEKINVLGLTAPELTDLVGQWEGKPFRARQLMRWVHQRSAGSFDVMTDLARDFRRTASPVARSLCVGHFFHSSKP